MGAHMGSSMGLFFLSLFSVNLTLAWGEKPEMYRNILWQTRSLEASKTLASILGAGDRNDIETARCSVRVVRPRLGNGVLVTPTNAFSCDLTSKTGTERSVSWALSAAPISPWGNRFYPKGFSLTAAHAEDLFVAMEKVHSLDVQDEHIAYREEHFSSPLGNFDVDEFVLFDEVLESSEERQAPLSCAKYYLYPAGEAKPSTPIKTRCDFIYQFGRIPGDLF